MVATAMIHPRTIAELEPGLIRRRAPADPWIAAAGSG